MIGTFQCGEKIDSEMKVTKICKLSERLEDKNFNYLKYKVDKDSDPELKDDIELYFKKI